MEGVPMVKILYGDYLIVASAQFNRATKFWIGQANIALASGPKLEWYTIIGPEKRHSSERDAEYFMISEAKNWIEVQLAKPADNPVPSEEGFENWFGR